MIDLSLPLIKIRTRSDATQITTGDISEILHYFYQTHHQVIQLMHSGSEK